MKDAQIPGYTYASKELTNSRLSDEEFALLKATLLFTEEDERYLRIAGDVLDDQVEDVLDTWYGFVAANPHLVFYFSDPNGNPNPEYLSAVRLRFGQSIRDTCAAKFDRQWLNYQYEIGLRHTRAKKNLTDGVKSAAAHIPLRYMIAFIYPITATMESFLAKKGHSSIEVEKNASSLV